MNWITDYVRPTLDALIGEKAETPDNMWDKCPQCEQMIFHRDLIENQHVCTHCDHHMRISAQSRLEQLYDDGKYTLIPVPDTPEDPLKFKDSKKYTDRLKIYRSQTKNKDAVLVAEGKIGNTKVTTAVFDFYFMGGSMGMAAGESIIKAAENAIRQKTPLLIVPASGGARMQEGILSLMQLPRSIIAVQMVRDARLAYIVLLTDPTTGGVSASFAMLGDITLAEPGCTVGFAGRRVIEETIREKLPDNFQQAEYLLEHGMVDRVIHRKRLSSELSTLFKLIHNKNT